jgi:serine/threonine protein kinase
VFNKGQVLSGRYRLVSLQGQGGMALVYRAYDLTLERTVAIKVLRPEYDAGDAFRHEARAIARLPHPNIVTVFDVGQHEGANYIVMEFVEGQDLKEWINTEAPFRTGRALDIIIQVCEFARWPGQGGRLWHRTRTLDLLGCAPGKGVGNAAVCLAGTDRRQDAHTGL